MNVMVAGGAGYIGSHAVKLLIKAGHTVVVVDNLCMGHKAAVDKKANFIHADLLETDILAKTLNEYKVECVMHFAALASVGESMTEPLEYYKNNTAGTVSLLEAMKDTSVNKLIFSSTCATYGEPESMPIVETMPQNPINPYGWSKLFVERVLQDYLACTPAFSFTALRYFNVAGCAADSSIGEDHTPENHIIPVVLQAANGKRKSITIFGTDYPTPDGTCIRDYVHVDDLCAAHIIAMNKLESGRGDFYNLGIGHGYSVKEIIDSAKRVTDIDFNVELGNRRPGDPPILYANADKIKRELGWQAKITDIDDIVTSAWNWFKANPDGYNDK